MGEGEVDDLNRKSSNVDTVSINKSMPKIHLVGPQRSIGQVVLSKKSRKGNDFVWDGAMFLLKLGALEVVRRFSRAKCPFVWSGIQALQAICYPPLKWIERWGPFKGLVNGMQMLSRPLLVLSIATAFSNQSDHNNVSSDAIDESLGPHDSRESPEPNTELPPVMSSQDTSFPDEALISQASTNWLFQLYTELEKEGIKLPERINENELQRFYNAANGDFRCLLSSVKKTIHWRDTYHILMGPELEMWSHLVFWHGFDVKNRHCLFVRLGLACGKLSTSERPRFVQAVVSQVEHGILHFVDPEKPQICVLVDCDGLSPSIASMQILKTCITILQEHFPDRLGLLLMIRLPPFVRAISQTFIQVLNPSTRKKLKIFGDMYQQFLTENFQTLPSYLGSSCTCRICSKPIKSNTQLSVINRPHETENISDLFVSEDIAITRTNDEKIKFMNGSWDYVLRSAVVGILLFWVLIALISGIYDPESRKFTFVSRSTAGNVYNLCIPYFHL